MDTQLRTLADLAEYKTLEDERKNRVSYESYLDNLVKLANEENNKVKETISCPKSNAEQKFICINEPIEFMDLFKTCSCQKEYLQLFREKIESKEPRIVSQIISNENQTSELWFNTTKNGINLRPGLRDGDWSRPDSILLGDDSVHALLGGRTGSGKSVLLNSIIFSIMSEYAPWEVDLFLVDFKKVEFKRYLSQYAVPHIKAVASTSEVRYVISLLRYLLRCMKARQNFFANVGFQKLEEVRDEFEIVLPRVLIIVDEFQQLFLESTPKQQGVIQEILTSIAKLGRATGFHLLFASQEMTGTLSSSVFANFKARFALQCERDVSNVILGNPSASDIEKRGIVIANIGGGKEGNMRFKVPIIDRDEYFSSFLSNMTNIAGKFDYKSVHKLYDEDSIKDFDILEKLLDDIKNIRRNKIDNSHSFFDILVLGEAVVFNYKKNDYETVFLERGVRKNIGIFSPSVDDTAYVCKLLAANFMKSPHADDYRNFILVRSDLFIKKYDILKDLSLKSESSNSLDLLNLIILEFRGRKERASLLRGYDKDSSLIDLAKKAFYLEVEYEPEEIRKVKEELFSGNQPWNIFEGRGVNDIPWVKEKIINEYKLEERYFQVLDMLYERSTEEKTIAELFKPCLVWIIGCEMVGKFPRELEEVLVDSTNYNMMFVLVASDINFGDFYMLHKSCNYLFVSENNESYYDKLRIPFYTKAETSCVIDFLIDNTSTLKSFKKFKYELSEVIVPEIDFDMLLPKNEN